MEIIPEKDLRKHLLSVTMPGRYVGGEYGIYHKKDANYNIALCFPDLYEIGMSNQALKLLYEIINIHTKASCQRVFVPAPDFEKILREESIDLYALESGKSIKEFDMLAFTIGYELAATNILNVLELSNIPLLNSDRKENDPIVIAGGPAVTNPLPFGSFIDCVFIGEAEDVFAKQIEELNDMKNAGFSRKEQLRKLRESPYFWYSCCQKKIKKALWSCFGINEKQQNDTSFVVPSVSVVQDHGVVEIMRGCPNGCRFCHAGIFYRPYREKSIMLIIKEIDNLISNCGYREITLSSLSTGDFSFIKELMTLLNEKYFDDKISFSLPSIRVNSLTLPLISEISKVRKSGLTFAVETPEIDKQRGLNKEAPKDRVIEILNEARKKGWNKAKFYFMLGLPFYNEDDETDLIIDFLREVGRRTKLNLNVNIGTFIPKPHTPFQWSFQLTEEKAFEKIQKIKKALPQRFFKLGYQSPFMSFLEGVISRGDVRVGELIISAFKKGARLDAWEEHLNKDVWREVIKFSGWDVENEISSSKPLDAILPWQDISLNVGESFLKKEWEKAFEATLTKECNTNCADKCGACNSENKVKINKNEEEIQQLKKIVLKQKEVERSVVTKENKILFSFEKKGKAEFLSHINIMTIFERAFIRAGFKLRFTDGFNPKPRLEFANPLTLGFASNEEIASAEMYFDININKQEIEKIFVDKMSSVLPQGLIVNKAKVITKLVSEKTGKKVKSLMATYGGSIYQLKCYDQDKNDELKKFISQKEGIKIVEEKKEEKKLIIKIAKHEGKIENVFKILKNELMLDNPFDIFEVLRVNTFTENEINYFDYYK